MYYITCICNFCQILYAISQGTPAVAVFPNNIDIYIYNIYIYIMSCAVLSLSVVDKIIFICAIISYVCMHAQICLYTPHNNGLLYNCKFW